MSFELGYGDIAFFLRQKYPFSKILPHISQKLFTHYHQALAESPHLGDLSGINVPGYGTR